MTDPSKSILFVCLGNICRSPLAESVFNHLLKERGLEGKWKVSSAGLGGWHVGKLPDARARGVAKRHGIQLESLARQIETSDFANFNFIMGMDEDNILALNGICPEGSPCKIELLGKYHSSGEVIIRDPYYDSGDDGFEICYQQCLECLNRFLDTHEPTATRK